MKPDDKKAVVWAVALILAILALVLPLWVVRSYYEAQAFERVTGKHVLTWDAMFLDLRVQEPAQAPGKEQR